MKHIFLLVLCCFSAKIEKNMPIFCNFFSLCINKLEESYKNNWSKHLTKFENVVSLQRVKHLTETITRNNNNKNQRENENQ